MDKHVIHINNRILLSHKKTKLPFAATWMNLEVITLSEVRQRQILDDVTYMWNLKKFYK